MKKLLLFALIAALVFPFVGCSDDDDDPPPPEPPFGPSLCAVGDDGMITVSGDALGWTEITAPTGLDVLDLVKVVKVPVSNRLVTFGKDSGASANSEIWFSDDGGSTWTEATSITVSALTGAHVTTGWTINDLMFVNQYEGFAVGNDHLILMTTDGGANWTEMNVWSDSAVVGAGTDVELDFSFGGGEVAPVQGTVLTQVQGAVTVTGTVVSYDDYWETCIVSNIAATGGTGTETFNNTDAITWGSESETASVDTTDIWRYDFVSGLCIYAVETAGTGTDTTVAIWFANSETQYYEGMWKIEGDAQTPSATVTRSWTWTTPSVTIQAGSTISDFSYDTVHRFFFFDKDTGIAARQTYGMLTTEDGGATWTFQTNSDISGFDEYWSEFWYIDNGATGWLYSLENDGYFVRTGIDYLATATPPYQFSSTVTFEQLSDSATNNDCYDGFRHTGSVLYSGRAFILAGASSIGYWTYGSTMGSTTFTDDVFSYTGGTYLGGLAANGSNPIYLNPVEGTGGASVDVEHWCQR